MYVPTGPLRASRVYLKAFKLLFSLSNLSRVIYTEVDCTSSTM